jgi:hypothetical protein
MKNELLSHKAEYFLLTTYSFFCGISFILIESKEIRQKILLLFILYYLTWGILHQIRIGKISYLMMMEYVLIATFGLLTLKVFL